MLNIYNHWMGHHFNELLIPKHENHHPLRPGLNHPEKKMRIVLIAENAPFRAFLSDCLSLSFSCLEADSVEKGYELVVKTNPDLVISEVQGSKKEGYKLCERIKSNQITCHLPILLLIPQDTPELMVEGYERGADACIVTPFKLSIVKAQIVQLIKNRELLKDKYKQRNFIPEPPAMQLPREEEFMVQLRQLMQENISDFNFNVQTLTSSLQMSHTSLYRKTKMLTGSSPVEFMLQYKMQQASQLLYTSESIKSIGYGLGFKNLSYFSKCFKKQYGVSPFAFRQGKR